MYLFKVQPIYFDQSKWSTEDAYKVLSTADDSDPESWRWDGDKPHWIPFKAYNINDAVRRGQYIYYSVTNYNTDDPYYNYIGIDLTVNENYTSATWRAGKGKDTWIRGRCLHDYDCINYVSPGATQRKEIELQIIPKAMYNTKDVTLFYNYGTFYLVLYGVVASTVEVTMYNSSDTIISHETVTSTEYITDTALYRRIIHDVPAGTGSSPELPVFLYDTLFFTMPEDAYRIRIKLSGNANTGSFVKLKHIFSVQSLPIGRTDGGTLSIGGLDYSRINYDDWGKMSLIQGKRAKTIRATIHLIRQAATHEERVIRLLQSCRATPTLFWVANTHPPVSQFLCSLTSVFGLIKNVSVDEISTTHREVSIQIDGIPVDYNP